MLLIIDFLPATAAANPVSISFNSAQKLQALLKSHNVDSVVIAPLKEPDLKYEYIILSSDCPIDYYDENGELVYNLPDWIIKAGVPVLGLGFGAEVVAKNFGAKMKPLTHKEEGGQAITEIIGNRQRTLSRYVKRSQRIISLPHQFLVTGVTYDNDAAVFSDRQFWSGVVYQPEMDYFQDFSVIQRFLVLGTTTVGIGTIGSSRL